MGGPRGCVGGGGPGGGGGGKKESEEREEGEESEEEEREEKERELEEERERELEEEKEREVEEEKEREEEDNQEDDCREDRDDEREELERLPPQNCGSPAHVPPPSVEEKRQKSPNPMHSSRVQGRDGSSPHSAQRSHSKRHRLLQPSPSSRLPSSHCSLTKS